ncbi:MAG: YlxR family protein [Oscillospiraceae bacterium]
MPERMCMVCRKRRDKSEFLRIVRVKGEEPKIDKTFKGQGRGVYVCQDEKCLRLAQKKRILERAFSCKVKNEVYDELLEAIIPK